ncbi:hypothetical protein GCM10010387_49870 [Streptomyces inusitatus]|uniref:Uncharacterized protein n=1 Tax=Streptomyces inusitatus TaxID=68221 RepID=A0A918QHA1_9ACTN|nr:hypothetical protein GCM10010387_49870 [Streptomyces inusitatus]
MGLKGGVVTAGKEWTDDGSVREIHSLKRRAAKATRPVPIPLILVRIFRNAKGDYIDASAYGSTWNRAREAALTLDEHALELANPRISAAPGRDPGPLLSLRSGIRVRETGSNTKFRLTA